MKPANRPENARLDGRPLELLDRVVADALVDVDRVRARLELGAVLGLHPLLVGVHAHASLCPPTRPSTVPGMRAAELDLDLDVFAGPFDLLMTVVLREEIALAEVELGEIVIAYLEHVEEQGELDLEAATEFLVLIASLLELKSRLLLPAPEEELLELAPEEAAEELLARMLEYRRYRDAAAHLAELFADGRRYLYRSAPLPPELRRVALDAARPSLRARPARGLDRRPAAGRRRSPTSRHIRPTVSLERAAARAARAARRRASSLDFDESFGDEDKLTQAVTLFALLELHKQGEATWEQGDVFGPIEVEAAR